MLPRAHSAAWIGAAPLPGLARLRDDPRLSHSHRTVSETTHTDRVKTDREVYKLFLPFEGPELTDDERRANHAFILERWSTFPRITQHYLWQSWAERFTVEAKQPPAVEVTTVAGSEQREAISVSKPRDTRQCFNCEQLGHVARDCPKPRVEGVHKRRGSRGSSKDEIKELAVLFCAFKKERGSGR